MYVSMIFWSACKKKSGTIKTQRAAYVYGGMSKRAERETAQAAMYSSCLQHNDICPFVDSGDPAARQR